MKLGKLKNVIIILAAATTACGGGGSGGGGGSAPPTSITPTPPPPTSSSCSLRSRQDFAFAVLNEWYLFPELLPSSLSPASYTTVQDYIDALTATARAQGKDRFFTYVTSIQEENAFFSSGSTAGFGVRFAYQGNRLFVIEAFEGAPALAAGLNDGFKPGQCERHSGDSGRKWRYRCIGSKHRGHKPGFAYIQRFWHAGRHRDQGQFQYRPLVDALRRQNHR
jgi:carboxyl-terminal processing protease